MIRTLSAVLLLSAAAPLSAQAVATAPATAPQAPASVPAMAGEIRAMFEDFMAKGHIPGLVYGVVKDGELVLVQGLGVQDTQTRTPVGPDTRFRIASMSKAFTAMAILKLRDEGKLSLDAPAERYVPELAGWRYPTSDSRRIRVADLLHHTAGFVEDNPWGDRQQPMPEAEFTALLRQGMDFAQPPGIRMEYSNLGYALLGRIVTNLSGRPYQDYIRDEIMVPLGMRSTGFDIFKSPAARRARGYRWQDGAWVAEPDMADGTFGAMGGVETSASDYARWVAFLLSAWPARDGPETGPVRRATVREIVEGANFVRASERPASPAGPACRAPVAYAKGWSVVEDCTVGRIVTHTGGYPGYGSVVMLLPDAGVGAFAFASRTYAAPVMPTLRALSAIRTAGLAPVRAVPVSAGLAQAYGAAKAAWTAGDATRAPLANNVLMDEEAGRRRASIAALKAKVGACPMNEPIKPISVMEGTFTWTCAKGAVDGRVQRAPTRAFSLQVIDFEEAPPKP